MRGSRVIVGIGLFAFGLMYFINRTGGSSHAIEVVAEWWPLTLVGIGL
jgi:hypothetical protein